jgi:hypothetical protein
MFYPQVFDFEGSTNGSVISILLGPSTALYADEILCLSKAGCLTIIHKSFQSSPEYCMNGTTKFSYVVRSIFYAER